MRPPRPPSNPSNNDETNSLANQLFSSIRGFFLGQEPPLPSQPQTPAIRRGQDIQRTYDTEGNSLYIASAAPPQIAKPDIRGGENNSGTNPLAVARPIDLNETEDAIKNSIKLVKEGNSKTIDLNEKGIGDEGMKFLFKSFPDGVEELILSRNNITGHGLPLIEGLTKLKSLKKIDFSHNKIDGEGAGFLGGLFNINPRNFILNFPFLNVVNLGFNEMGDEGIAKLFNNNDKVFVEELILSNNNIGNNGANLIAKSLPRFICLKKIDLSRNSIGDKGAEILAITLARPTSGLSEVNLDYNQITDKGLRHLIDFLPLPCCGLTKISVDGSISVLGLGQLLEEAVEKNASNRIKLKVLEAQSSYYTSKIEELSRPC